MTTFAPAKSLSADIALLAVLTHLQPIKEPSKHDDNADR